MTRGDHEDTYWLYVLIKRETSKAWLLNDGRRDHWFPKSQVRDSEEELGVGVMTQIEVPAWIAEKNDLNVDNEPIEASPHGGEREVIRKIHDERDDGLPF